MKHRNAAWLLDRIASTLDELGCLVGIGVLGLALLMLGYMPWKGALFFAIVGTAAAAGLGQILQRRAEKLRTRADQSAAPDDPRLEPPDHLRLLVLRGIPELRMFRSERQRLLAVRAVFAAVSEREVLLEVFAFAAPEVLAWAIHTQRLAANANPALVYLLVASGPAAFALTWVLLARRRAPRVLRDQLAK